MGRPAHSMSVAERLELHSMPEPNSGCQLWLGKVNHNGYGTFWNHADGFAPQNTAHRAAYVLANGPVSPGAFVCHRCDVRSCINPAHLFLGTAADNNADMVAKGRQARGDTCGKSKLTSAAVRLIFADERSKAEIGRVHGVNAATVRDIKFGRTWRHITGMAA